MVNTPIIPAGLDFAALALEREPVTRDLGFLPARSGEPAGQVNARRSARDVDVC